MERTEKIINALGCEYLLIENVANTDKVMSIYKEHLNKGKSEGYIPLLMVPSEQLLDMIEYFIGDIPNTVDYRSETIKKSETIDSIAYIETRIHEAMPEVADTYDIYGVFDKQKSNNQFCTDFSTRKPYSLIILLKVPTTNPWELAAWIPMGGWNDCPMPEEQITVFRRWYENYGAFPAVVHGDIWELYVEHPVKSETDAKSLALEQFGFCPDIVLQGCETVNRLAGSLIDSSVWFFWWD